MKVLVVGKGGREHALVWKIAQSPRVDAIYAAPGNPGMADQAQLVDLAVDTSGGKASIASIDELAAFVEKEGIDLTVVGPEDVLGVGLVDRFASRGLKAFGPTAAAARIADARRADHLARGASFATETVFSHPSKLALVEDAKASGFDVILFHVGVARPDLSVARVAERVREGGHPVPEAKIRARYDRNGPLIRAAMLLASRGFVFDNSALNRPPALLMRFAQGRLTSAAPDIPDWARAIYAAELAA